MFEKIKRFVRCLLSSTSRNEIPREAACIAFYAIFSLAPLLVVGVFVGGVVFGETQVQVHLVALAESYFGEEASQTVGSILKQPLDLRQGIVASSVSVVILLIGATKVFAELRFALNKTFHARPQNMNMRGKLWHLVKSRMLGVGLVLFTGMFVGIDFLAGTVFRALADELQPYIPYDIGSILTSKFWISLMMMSFLITVLIKVLPSVRVPLRYAFPSALLSAFVFVWGKDLFGMLLAAATASSPYGAASSLLIILLWIYLATIILLVGAEVCHAMMASSREN